MGAPAPELLAFAVRGPIGRDDLAGLCDRICALLAANAGATALCDVGGVPADAVTADALARLQLAARRRGCQIRLRNVSDDLRALLALMGLDDVLLE